MSIRIFNPKTKAVKSLPEGWFIWLNDDSYVEWRNNKKETKCAWDCEHEIHFTLAYFSKFYFRFRYWLIIEYEIFNWNGTIKSIDQSTDSYSLIVHYLLLLHVSLTKPFLKIIHFNFSLVALLARSHCLSSQNFPSNI